MCRRVLLIEDDEILRFLIADALSHVDVEVIECTTADAGLVVLENAPATRSLSYSLISGLLAS